MDSPSGHGSTFDGSATYRITVLGVISLRWCGRALEGMTINRLTLEDGSLLSILTGELADQAALTGVLNTLYELRLPLIAVKRLPLPGSRGEESPHRPDGDRQAGFLTQGDMT